MIENYNNWLLPATVAITTTIVVGAAFGGYIYYQSNQTNAFIVKLQEEINALKLAEIDLRKVIVDPAVEYKGMNLINQNEILLNKITELTAFREQHLSKVSFWKIDAIFQHFKEGINDDGLVSIYQNIVLLQKKFKASDLHNYLLDKTGGDLIAPNPYTPIDVLKLQPHFEKITPITGKLKEVLMNVANQAKDKISHTFDHAQDTFNYTTESQALAADLGDHLKTHIVTFFTACDKTFLKVMKTFSTWSPDFPVDCTMIALEAPIQISEISNLLSQDGFAACGIATFCHFSGGKITSIALSNPLINTVGFVPILKVNTCVYSTTHLLLQEMQLFNILILKHGAAFLAQNPHIMDYLRTHPDDLVTLQQLFFISKTSIFSNCFRDIDLIGSYLVQSNLENTIPWIEFYNNFIKEWNYERFLSNPQNRV